ncbi:hypothetical protein l13_18180 [Neisseria weaveri ATCC 51223]|nr:hypothetical protein l13_18180 [Neisseria weaveri ATCC 51223]
MRNRRLFKPSDSNEEDDGSNLLFRAVRDNNKSSAEYSGA